MTAIVVPCFLCPSDGMGGSVFHLALTTGDALYARGNYAGFSSRFLIDG